MRADLGEDYAFQRTATVRSSPEEAGELAANGDGRPLCPALTCFLWKEQLRHRRRGRCRGRCAERIFAVFRRVST
jgi:hypothetical protein